VFALGEHGVEHVPLVKAFYVSNFAVFGKAMKRWPV
jgi:hypothetical protein